MTEAEAKTWMDKAKIEVVWMGPGLELKWIRPRLMLKTLSITEDPWIQHSAGKMLALAWSSQHLIHRSWHLDLEQPKDSSLSWGIGDSALAGTWTWGSQRIYNCNDTISTSPFDSTRLTLGLGTAKRFIISFGQTGFLESSHQTNSSIYYPFQLIWLYWFKVGKLDWLGRIHNRLHWFRPGKTALIYSIDRRLQMYWEAAQRG